jgi:hypothetical protein
MDLTAGLAQSTLKAVKTTHAATSTANWAAQMVASASLVLQGANLLHASTVADRLREWSYDLSAAGLTRRLETRAAKGEPARMIDLVQAEWRRLEREGIGEPVAKCCPTLLDSLRKRMDTALTAAWRSAYQFAYQPSDLAYAKGYGLIWAVSAFEVERQIKRRRWGFRRSGQRRQATIMPARRLWIAQQHDANPARGSAAAARTWPPTRRARPHSARLANDRRPGPARRVAESGMMADNLRPGREVIPLVEQAGQSLGEFETAAAGDGRSQPPTFQRAWFSAQNGMRRARRTSPASGSFPARPADGVHSLGATGRCTARAPESRFLLDIRDAARRALASTFRFPDLYEFLNQHDQDPAFRQAVAALPGAATPPLVPVADDKHQPPAPYEIVREVPRPFSALPPLQNGVVRSFLPRPIPTRSP